MKKLLILTVVSVLIYSDIYGQQNAIKTMIIVIPVPTLFAASLSVGYERRFTKNHTLDISGFYMYSIDEMGTGYDNYAFMPGYKYYFTSDHKFINNIWLSGYGLYIYSTHVHTEDGLVRCRKNYFGGGISTGKRLFLNWNKVFFMDIGIGYSFSVVNSNSNTGLYSSFPRPILQLGWVF